MLEAVLTGIALAMDAFAVSICAGACEKFYLRQTALKLGAAFGLFQFMMPLIGWAMGDFAQKFFQNFAAYLAFIILLLTGLNMIYDYFKSRNKDLNNFNNPAGSLKILIPAAMATSIDALMIGAGFALADMSVLNLAIAAGVLTFIICFAGVYLGRALGSKFGNKAGLLGGVVLILIGVNILVK
ncbi:MAG: manganese efflux pump [Synergistaceae bacterium]|nr:manganese efflux pump [Synergistaceae bacterium]MBR0096457.1 manganese efflux pump [Synergistaceae bacterium]